MPWKVTGSAAWQVRCLRIEALKAPRIHHIVHEIDAQYKLSFAGSPVLLSPITTQHSATDPVRLCRDLPLPVRRSHHRPNCCFTCDNLQQLPWPLRDSNASPLWLCLNSWIAGSVMPCLNTYLL